MGFLCSLLISTIEYKRVHPVFESGCAYFLKHMEGGSGSREEEPWLKLGLPNTEDWPLKQKSKRFAADTALPSNIPHKRFVLFKF